MIALIIPTFPPHYKYIYNLLNKYIYNYIDIYLVFSNKDDMSLFEYKDKIYYFVLNNEDITINNIVLKKKFYALLKLINNQKYEYFIVCDSEIDIIKENFNINNIYKKITHIFDNKYIYSGTVNNDYFNNTTKKSTEFFLIKDDIIKLKELTLNYKLYYWFSDLPVYKRSHLYDFFSKIDYTNTDYAFDHLIYLNYLALYHNFKFVNITPILNYNFSLELYNTTDIEDLKKLEDIKYSFSWVTDKFFNNNKDYLLQQGSFLLYHIDRNHIDMRTIHHALALV